MSIDAVRFIADHSDAVGANYTVLWWLAFHAGRDLVLPAGVDEDTAERQGLGWWEAWPKLDTICDEAHIDRPRTVTDALTWLVDHGEIERVINGARSAGPVNRRANLYRILRRKRTLAEQLESRFTHKEIAAHPALAVRVNDALTSDPLYEAVDTCRGQRVPLDDPGAPQVWVVQGETHRRVAARGFAPWVEIDGLDIDVDPKRDHLEPLAGVPVSDTPGDNPPPGVSSGDTPGSEDGSGVSLSDAVGCRSATARVSLSDGQGCRPATPRTKERTSLEPSLNDADVIGSRARTHEGPVDDARQRLAELLGRRTDRPGPTTGLRTGRQAYADARAKAWAATRPEDGDDAA